MTAPTSYDGSRQNILDASVTLHFDEQKAHIMAAGCVFRGDNMLGSCVAVSAALLPQQLAELKQQWHPTAAGTATPLHITHGSQDLELPRARVEATLAAAKQLGMNRWSDTSAQPVIELVDALLSS